MRAVLASITAGIAKITMNEVTTCAQTKIGTRLGDMPGARILNAVVMISTDTASAATSVNVMSCAHTSARLPGEYSGPDSGTYANHPTSGPVFNANMVKRKTPPNRYIQ